MARMTASDMVTFLRKGASNVTTTEWSDAHILRILNMCAEDIAMSHRPRYLEETFTISCTANKATYDLPATAMVIYDGWNSTYGNRLKPTNRIHNTMTTQAVSTKPPGTVYRWFESGDTGTRGVKQIVVQDTPSTSQTIELYGLRFPVEATITGTVTSLDLPREYDQLVLERARLRLLSWDAGANARDVDKIVRDTEVRVPRFTPAERRTPISTPVGRAAGRTRR